MCELSYSNVTAAVKPFQMNLGKLEESKNLNQDILVYTVGFKYWRTTLLNSIIGNFIEFPILLQLLLVLDVIIRHKRLFICCLQKSKFAYPI